MLQRLVETYGWITILHKYLDSYLKTTTQPPSCKSLKRTKIWLKRGKYCAADIESLVLNCQEEYSASQNYQWESLKNYPTQIFGFIFKNTDLFKTRQILRCWYWESGGVDICWKREGGVHPLLGKLNKNLLLKNHTNTRPSTNTTNTQIHKYNNKTSFSSLTPTSNTPCIQAQHKYKKNSHTNM